jgi:hypothetical protein
MQIVLPRTEATEVRSVLSNDIFVYVFFFRMLYAKEDNQQESVQFCSLCLLGSGTIIIVLGGAARHIGTHGQAE